MAALFRPLIPMLLLAGLILAACGGGTVAVTDSDTKDKAYYTMFIEGADGVGVTDGVKVFAAGTIESTFDDEQGTIWLGTDKYNVPIATITMEIRGYIPSSTEKTALIDNLTISTTDAHSGTSDVLNAKLYHADEAYLTDYKRGANYISGKISTDVAEIASGKIHKVTLEFVALSN